MRRKGKTLLRWSGYIVLLLFLAVIFAAGAKWFFVTKSGKTPEVIGTPVLTVEKPKLGEIFYLQAICKVPWGQPVPGKGAAVIPEKLQQAGKESLSFRKLAWGYTLWQAALPLQGYEAGKTAKGVLWNLTSGGKELSISSPEVTIEKLALSDTALAMAASYTPPKKRPLYPLYIGGAALVLLLAGAIWFFLRKKKHPVHHLLPPWEEAQNAIALLVGEVRNGKKKTERALVILSDILSSYIEKRFSIRSTHLTSGEFLHELEKNSRILEESQQRFLRKFLESADLVKFAALPAGNELWEQAAKDAGNFIEETRIHPAGKEEKKS